MAVRLDTVDLPFAFRQLPAYPWDEWLDGSTWKLVRGEDFKCSDHWMKVVARRMATERGMELRTSVRPDGLYIQAVQAVAR